MTEKELIRKVNFLCTFMESYGFHVSAKPYFTKGLYSFCFYVAVIRDGGVKTLSLNTCMGTKEEAYQNAKAQLFNLFMRSDVYSYEI